MKKRLMMVIITLFLPVMALFAMTVFSAKVVRAEEIEHTLPTVYLHIDGGQEEIDKMNSSPDHSYHCTGSMDIEVPEGFKYTDSDADLSSVSNLAMDIRGRGNTTWEYVGKKPYKIKLDKKKSLLGMGSNKHWALISNVFDPTMMRNRITLWLGHELGMDYTPFGYPVDVYMENEYYGSYLLCETIRVAENRIDIGELTEEDTTFPTISGGYLMSMLQDPGARSTFMTVKGEELQNVTPSFDPEDDDYENEAQKKYIRDYVQEAEYALNEGFIKDENDPSGYRDLNYRDYFDIRSTSFYWLMQEFSKNSDAYNTGSSYFYKTRDQEGQPGKIYWGPFWDFDFAWDNNEFDEDESIGTIMGWMTAMMTDTSEGGLPDQIQKNWPLMKQKLYEITEEGGLLDRYYEEIKASHEADYEKYKSERFKDFRQAVEVLREWINKRILWMDSRIGDLNNYSHKVFLKSDPEDTHPQVFCVPAGSYYNDNSVAPEKDGLVFIGWYTDQGEKLDDVSIDEDTVATARYISEDDAIKTEKLYFDSYEKWIPYSTRLTLIQSTCMPKDAQDTNIKWISSDETIAVVSKDHIVTFLSKGDVTITGTLKSGVSNSFILHICDKEDLQPITAVKLPQDKIRLNPGEYQQLLLNITPANTMYTTLFWSQNDDVAEIDSNGVILAKKNGKALIDIDVMDSVNEDGDYFHLTCEVIVGNESGTEKSDIPKVKAKMSSQGKILLNWKKIAGASGYKVAYRKTGAKKWTFKKVTNPKATIKGLKTGKLYQFKVAAIKKNGKSSKTGRYSSVLYRYYKGMNSLKCKGKKKAIQIAWKKVKGASGYRIRISSHKDFSKAKTINVKARKKTYTVKGLESGKKYYIAVQPYKTKGGKAYLGMVRKKTVKTR